MFVNENGVMAKTCVESRGCAKGYDLSNDPLKTFSRALLYVSNRIGSNCLAFGSRKNCDLVEISGRGTNGLEFIEGIIWGMALMSWMYIIVYIVQQFIYMRRINKRIKEEESLLISIDSSKEENDLLPRSPLDESKEEALYDSYSL
ncbi:hypothetical protein K6025_05225 [Ehrlichia sp. JZT12]